MSRPQPREESRRRQVLGGWLAILFVGGLIAFGWIARDLPGFLGEWFGMIVGIVTTPFLMEASFIVLGLLLVISINCWRLRREGDEFVYLEQAEGPGSEKLPTEARSVIYRDHPLAGEAPDLLTRAEGALEIGDHDTALEAVAEMDEQLRSSREALDLRIRLARATGKDDLADRLTRDRDAGH